MLSHLLWPCPACSDAFTGRQGLGMEKSNIALAKRVINCNWFLFFILANGKRKKCEKGLRRRFFFSCAPHPFSYRSLVVLNSLLDFWDCSVEWLSQEEQTDKEKENTNALRVVKISALSFEPNTPQNKKRTHFQAAVVPGDELSTLLLLLTAFSAFCLTQRIHYRLVNIIFKH